MRVPGFPFVLVARIRAFDQQGLWLHFDGDGEDFLAVHIVNMGALVIAPADMKPDAVRRNVGERVIERFDL